MRRITKGVYILMRTYKKTIIGLCVTAAFIIVLLIVGLRVADYYNLLPQKAYTAEDFGITMLQSSVDFNGNGTDDYTDFLLGAKKDAENHPTYDGSYYDGGFPPDDIGVCTDVIWRAFRQAGYDLREMVNNDIKARPEAYTSIKYRDKNIDFRRVKNLYVFFKQYAVSLTTDITQIEEWQAGDIVIFGNNSHIGIVSDKRNKKGQPYIIHNEGQPNREEDYLKRGTVTAHFRFDASLIDSEYLVAWST